MDLDGVVSNGDFLTNIISGPSSIQVLDGCDRW